VLEREGEWLKALRRETRHVVKAKGKEGREREKLREAEDRSGKKVT